MLTSRNQFSYSHLFLFLFLWKSFSTLSPYLFAERRVSDSGPTRESSKEHSTRSGRLSTSSIGGSQPLTRLARLLNQRPSFTPSDEIPRRLSWERYVTKSAIVKFLKYRTSLRRLEKGRRRRRRRRRKKRKKPKKKKKKIGLRPLPQNGQLRLLRKRPSTNFYRNETCFATNYVRVITFRNIEVDTQTLNRFYRMVRRQAEDF